MKLEIHAIHRRAAEQRNRQITEARVFAKRGQSASTIGGP